MTVIAWDGKILAADKQVTYGNLRRVTRKIFKVGDCFVAFAGTAGTSHVLLNWFKSGEKKEAWPSEIQQTEEWSHLIVANKSAFYWYDRHPYKLHLRQKLSAWGIGSDFAIGAMEAGADAITAVRIASKHCEGCGFGVDWFQVR